MNFVSLISGGIDSPVASYMMAERGANVILVHMDNGIYSSDGEIDKIKLIVAHLKKITKKDLLMSVKGNARTILLLERTVLNLSMRMSGVASAASYYSSLVKNSQKAGLKEQTCILYCNKQFLLKACNSSE